MRFSPLIISMMILGLLSVSVSAQTTSNTEKTADTTTNKALEVIDPFAEMHTGPGRGYPIFYVIEQGESIQILTRRPDWYEVKTQKGQTGWVKASQIARTLKPTGEPVDLPSISYGDYLKNSWRVGFSVGPFSKGKLDDTDSFNVNAGYRPLSWLSFDAEYGRFYGNELRGNLYNLNAIVEPFSKWKVSPVLLLGSGKIEFEQQPKQPLFEIEKSSLNLYGIGLHYYLGRSFVVKAEYRKYNLSTKPEKERAGTWKIGFNTFF